LPQAFAGEITYTVIAEASGLLFPVVPPAVFDGDRDRARLWGGAAALFSRRRGIFGYIVVQDGLPLARSDIEPSVRAAQPAESVAEAGRKKLRVARESPVGGVDPATIGAPAAVDFFLLEKFLLDPRVNGFL